MSVTVGLDIQSDIIRAITVRRWRAVPTQTFSLRWDPSAPADAVRVLRENLGEVSSIGIAVGFEFLHVKQVKLPPTPLDERRRMLLLEPDRFFPIEDGTVVVSVNDTNDIVFAADAELIESLVAALGRWAQVSCVEAAPVAFARAVKKAGLRRGTFSLPAGEDERGLIQVADGELRTARRAAVAGEKQDSDALANLKTGIPREYFAAYGAALGVDGDPEPMLVSEVVYSRMRKRRSRAVLAASMNFVLALVFLLGSADRWRSRTLHELEAEIASQTPRAAVAAALQDRLATMNLESSAATDVGGRRSDPLAVLAAIGRRLPRDATVMSARAEGDKWQIDGTALNASSLIPALTRESQFEDVRFLSASSRFRDRGRTYESFSIGFHVRPST